MPSAATIPSDFSGEACSPAPAGHESTKTTEHSIQSASAHGHAGQAGGDTASMEATSSAQIDKAHAGTFVVLCVCCLFSCVLFPQQSWHLLHPSS